MKVWIDQDLCTGDGLCEEIAPSVFTLLDDGLAYVKEGDKVFSDPGGADGLANFADNMLDAVVEAAGRASGDWSAVPPAEAARKAGEIAAQALRVADHIQQSDL